jgi:hypothetical protein
VASISPSSLKFKKTKDALGFPQFIPKSSFIAVLEYDEQNLTLTTHMKNGAIYQAKNVDPDEWEELQAAPNASSYWSNNIRGAKESVKLKVVRAPNSGIKLGGSK